MARCMTELEEKKKRTDTYNKEKYYNACRTYTQRHTQGKGKNENEMK